MYFKVCNYWVYIAWQMLLPFLIDHRLYLLVRTSLRVVWTVMLLIWCMEQAWSLRGNTRFLNPCSFSLQYNFLPENFFTSENTCIYIKELFFRNASADGLMVNACLVSFVFLTHMLHIMFFWLVFKNLRSSLSILTALKYQTYYMFLLSSWVVLSVAHCVVISICSVNQ